MLPSLLRKRSGTASGAASKVCSISIKPPRLKKIIADIVEQLGRKPSCRQMSKLLRERGVDLSFKQVNNYYQRMPSLTDLQP